MDNREQPERNAAALPELAQPEARLTAGGAARRRFGRAGLGASGVILTLASQPGMATSLVCASASGSLSKGLQSKPSDQTLVCAGLSPGYWKKPSRAWPHGATRDTLFCSVFAHGGTTLYKSGKMIALLTNNDPAQDPYNLGMHLVATYLNILSGKISFLKVTDLTKMWNDLVTYGHYVPTAGQSWNAEALKNYLQKTHD